MRTLCAELNLPVHAGYAFLGIVFDSMLKTEKPAPPPLQSMEVSIPDEIYDQIQFPSSSVDHCTHSLTTSRIHSKRWSSGHGWWVSSVNKFNITWQAWWWAYASVQSSDPEGRSERRSAQTAISLLKIDFDYRENKYLVIYTTYVLTIK